MRTNVHEFSSKDAFMNVDMIRFLEEAEETETLPEKFIKYSNQILSAS